MDTDGCTSPTWGRRRRARRPPASTVLWLLMGIGCSAQRPSGERAPSSAPEVLAPTPPPPAAPAPAPAESPQRKRQELPGSGKDAAESPSTARPAATAPLAPQKSAAPKARSLPKSEAAEDGRNEGELGGAANEEANPRELRRRLDRAYRAASPDCPSARDRKQAVCDLASQICQLIDRDPNVASVAEYCADAKERCAEAERRTRERCPE